VLEVPFEQRSRALKIPFCDTYTAILPFAAGEAWVTMTPSGGHSCMLQSLKAMLAASAHCAANQLVSVTRLKPSALLEGPPYYHFTFAAHWDPSVSPTMTKAHAVNNNDPSP
jgi:hypothetical protein